MSYLSSTPNCIRLVLFCCCFVVNLHVGYSQTFAKDSAIKSFTTIVNMARKSRMKRDTLEYAQLLDSLRNIHQQYAIQHAPISIAVTELVHAHQTFQYEKGLALADSIDLIIDDEKWVKYKANFLMERSTLLFRLSRLSESLYYLKQALEAAENHGNLILRGKILANLGNRYFRLGDDEKALEYYLESLAEKQKNDDTNSIPFTLQGLAAIYSRQANSEKAIEVGMEAIRIFQANDQNCEAVRVYGMVAAEIYNLGSLDSGKLMLRQTIELADRNQCKYGSWLSSYALGHLECLDNNHAKGIECYQKALEGGSLLDDRIRTTIMIEMVRPLLRLGDRELAGRYLDSARARIDSIEGYSIQMSFYVSEDAFYQSENNWSQAYESARKAQAYRDSIRNQERDALLEETRVKFDVARLEDQQKSLSENLGLKERELKLSENNNRLKNGILVFGLLALLTGAGAGFFFFQRQQQRNKLQERTLRDQLRRSQINPHFFFNVLNSIQAMINREGEKKKVVQGVARFAQLMRQTLESSFNDYVSIEEETKRLENYLSLEQLRFASAFQFSIELHCSPELLIPSQLVQPFVENAVEHGLNNQKNGSLKLIFTPTDQDRLCIEIRDNGPGTQQEKPNQRKSRSMEIIQQRMELFGNKKRFFFQLQRYGPETVATLYCPVK